jgi:vancomycin permeability regulator SanA
LWTGAVAAALVVVVTAGSVCWAYLTSAGHRHALADAPSAPVVIVFGAEVDTPFLTGRLAATVDLVRSGRVGTVLVSGNAAGSSGDETSEMVAYLVARGVPRSRMIVDPSGVDTYATCARAVQLFGVRRALLVTQPYHLPRAVSLCRDLGMDADGVAAPCACGGFLLFRNEVREWFASVLALGNTIWPRRAVTP